jgi:hypothetical protein
MNSVPANRCTKMTVTITGGLNLSLGTDGPWTTCGPGPLVTRSVKSCINLLLVTTVSFIFFTLKDLKNNDSSLGCFWYKCHT